MEVINSDESDYEVDFSNDRTAHDGVPGTGHRGDQDSREQTDGGDLKGEISKGVATYVWEEGRQRARKAFSLYANIDILRPYYDVEPREVRSRLLRSLVPRLTVNVEGKYPKVPRELYGPTMLVFTLIAMLLYQMKSSGHTVQEGTLMGTAFATCFGYWFGIASLVWVLGYVCSTRITMTQILNLLGYALFGHCIVLFLTTLIHPSHSHLLFYILWLSFGGLATLKMATVLMSRTPGRSQKLTICAVIVVIHLLFLLYLHFAYHRVVEDVSEVFNGHDEHIEQLVTPVAADSNVFKKEDLHSDAVLGKLKNESHTGQLADQVGLTVKRSLRSNSSVLHRLVARDTSSLNVTLKSKPVRLADPAMNVAANSTSLLIGGLASA
jgi:tryptophan-rich sensory protein